MVPKITEIIPLVRGTVESQRIPSNAEKISTVISVLGRKMNTKMFNDEKMATKHAKTSVRRI